jgi:drug/metabolite transporter (DMT)-like permease
MTGARSGSPSSVEQGGSGGVYLLLLLQAFTAAGTHLVAKVVVESVDPFTLTLVRSFIAAAGMGTLLLIRGKRVSIRREDRGLVLLLGFLGISLNQFLFLYGIRFTTAANAALLYSTTPIIVLLFSRGFLGERMSQRKVLGILIAFAGVLLVIFERGLDASMQFVYGNLIIFVAVTAWGLYTVLGKRLITRYGPIEASACTMLVGTALFLPIGLVSALHFPYETLGTGAWLQIGYLGLVTSVVAYLLWYSALARIEAAKAALFTNLQPILTTILAVLLLGQDVTLQFVVGGVIAIFGVVLAQFG